MAGGRTTVILGYSNDIERGAEEWESYFYLIVHNCLTHESFVGYIKLQKLYGTASRQMSGRSMESYRTAWSETYERVL